MDTSVNQADGADEVALLRAEIEELQYELAERDAQAMELSAAPAGQETLDDDTAHQLVQRLEQLLEELQRSDERVGDLEQLLRASEEANRAEREERHQLEAWVSDIEQRIGEREVEWDAEKELLERRLAAYSRERDELLQQQQGQMQASPASDATDTSDPHELWRLRDEKFHLQQQLEAAQQRASQLEAELQQQQQQQQDCEGHWPDAHTEIREAQLQIAQERAALTRQKAELAAMQAELERLPRDGKSESDQRVRAFREHLREIHDQQPSTGGQQSLANRITRLWKRLEGRPS